MKYCTHCGQELLDEAVVCPKCGCAASSRSESSSGNWNVMAIVGFALSFFNAIAGLVVSIIARRQIRQSGERGMELATAGVIISSVLLALIALVIIIWVAFLIIFLSQRPVPLN